MPVELSQKGNNIRVTISVDGSDLLFAHNKAIESLETQRQAGLQDRESNKVKTPLTPLEIASVNSTYDTFIAAEKRQFQVRLLDLCRTDLSHSINATAYDEVDISAEKAERKAKVDAEFDAVVARKPIVDVDVIK
jgi:hypothetical protein